ncbi:hypothetical protein SAMD00023353_2101010 [Rosellinia necatrix]|uniref:Uncharacterized protein n=1 Tax=Rosellinia necatrix TaxID=77044 RepID=A0A1W2TFF4_ROSNE|nr:hypothetical protein SAMD00023353_2101010 [Rosellinia necatrix]
MHPQEFFAYITTFHEWSRNIDNEAFWRFTYRLFHARAIFLAKYDPARGSSQCNPLATALDGFRNAFLARYPPKSNFFQVHEADRIEMADPVSEYNEMKRRQYFRYSDADCEGDQTDRLVRLVIRNPGDDPHADAYSRDKPIPAEMENMAGWYFDLGPGHPRFGHTDINSAGDQYATPAETNALYDSDHDGVVAPG